MKAVKEKIFSDFNYLKLDISDEKLRRGVNIAFSILSDAQELISMGCIEKANETINNAKLFLMGKFKEEDPFYAEIIKE